MFSTQPQPTSQQRNTGGYPWVQTNQQPDPAFGNNQSQASNNLGGWPWLDANRLGHFQTEQAEGLPLLSSLAPAQPNISTSSTTTTAGPPQSHTLNIILKSDQSESSSQNAELHARIKVLEGLLGEVRSSLASLTEKVEMQRLSHEEKCFKFTGSYQKGDGKIFHPVREAVRREGGESGRGADSGG
ncbi:hypothetical protein CEP52_014773 [Fusarium oligoseptatum]|uniref:Uncharacterized protein n=1 Tax=Fusarium oligoseptatum TaxID=2604345 RepID=A0A428SJ76_9HYPO|nr:hypothetical protein CEP52_014773 [Fusarium oligoseptatum]